MPLLRTEEVILLVKSRFENEADVRAHIMTVRPDEDGGWIVFVESGGVVWRQRVSCDGVLGSCSRLYSQLEWVKH